MRLLIDIMLYTGSALMLYNIIRYAAFVKNRVELEQGNRQNGLLVVPLLLLIFFFIGYLAVSITDMADLLMAAILFFGSVYVFLVLTVMYSIIRRIQDTEQVLSAQYEEMKAELDAMVQDSLASFRVNLTKDEVEARSGDGLYDSDWELDRYSQLLEARQQYILDHSDAGEDRALFTREGLLRHYEEGQTSVSEVCLVRRRNGEASYVRLEASLGRKPASGDIVAFLVERPYNTEVVQQTLLQRVLMDQYDRIAYLIDGRYRVLISNDGKKSGLLLPPDAEGTYEDLYLNYILPAVPRDGAWPEGPNPLRPSVIDRVLAERDSYDVNAPFVIEGETRYKHIVFYVIDRKARYYLMLLSDSTAIQEEQTRRNRELSDALAEAVRANQSRTRFFTNVSHDLRTPMNGILGFTGLAREEQDPEKRRAYLDKAEASGRQLLEQVDDLLAMSLIDSGKLEMDAEAEDLKAMVRELEQRYATGDQEGAGLETDCSGLREARVLCDGPRLRHALIRLLDSAGTFTEGKGRRSLTLTQEDCYVFRIRCSGCTAAPELVERSLAPEAWEDSALAAALPGVGLGMTVAREYIAHMGGSVEVSASDGQAEIQVRLPLVPLPAAEEGEEELPERQLRVLLVDDNEINREIGELLLSGAGFIVTLAGDGAEAVEKVAASAPGDFDAVLMDVQMPVLNGYEATARIRALPDPAQATIPIIALTANAYQEDSNAAAAAGMNGYATKPLDPERIRAEIAKAIHG